MCKNKIRSFRQKNKCVNCQVKQRSQRKLQNNSTCFARRFCAKKWRECRFSWQKKSDIFWLTFLLSTTITSLSPQNYQKINCNHFQVQQHLITVVWFHQMSRKSPRQVTILWLKTWHGNYVFKFRTFFFVPEYMQALTCLEANIVSNCQQ